MTSRFESRFLPILRDKEKGNGESFLHYKRENYKKYSKLLVRHSFSCSYLANMNVHRNSRQANQHNNFVQSITNHPAALLLNI